jgi:hypothetical protein
MPKPPSKLPVCDKDLENLRASGLSTETIRVNGLYTEHDMEKLAALLNRKGVPDFCLGGALVFPYFDDDGKPNCYARVRPRFPRKDREGKPVKYESPVGQPARAYIPPSSRRLLRDGKCPIYLAEGEKKTLALSQLGWAAVGIGGTYSWKVKGTDELIPDLAAMMRQQQEVYIVFDFDSKPATRQQTAWAARRLARALRKAGAKEVYEIQLPPGPNGAKQGVDDFLVAHGPEEFRKLVEKAQPVPILNAYAAIIKAEGRTDVNNAARLAARCEEVVRWVGPWDKWLLWDGSRWKLDQSLAIDLKAKEIAVDVWEEMCQAIKENQE